MGFNEFLSSIFGNKSTRVRDVQCWNAPARKSEPIQPTAEVKPVMLDPKKHSSPTSTPSGQKTSPLRLES